MEAENIKASLEKTRTQALNHLTDLRAEIERINDELHWLEHAPLVLEDAQAAIERFIGAHTQPTESVRQFFYPKGLNGPGPLEANVELNRYTTMRAGDTLITNGTASLADVLVPLFGPSTIQRMLFDMVTRIADSIESGPPLAERPALKADLEKRKYALEVEEEQLIYSAEELGMDGFYRRHDCNPEIVLMMEA